MCWLAQGEVFGFALGEFGFTLYQFDSDDKRNDGKKESLRGDDNLSGSHTDDRAARIVVFSATVGQFHRQMLVHEHTIHTIIVQAMTNWRHFRIVDDADQLMPFYYRMMLRKRYIIETINDMLKNTAQIVHSRHRSVNNFIMNLISALGAYCFFDNKPKALQGYCIEDTKQLSLF